VDKLIPPSYHAQALGEPFQPIELRVKIHTPSAISYVRSLGGRVARLCLVGRYLAMQAPLPTWPGKMLCALCTRCSTSARRSTNRARACWQRFLRPC
jgi:hypothetical protein